MDLHSESDESGGSVQLPVEDLGMNHERDQDGNDG